jgi:hypothetical protein
MNLKSKILGTLAAGAIALSMSVGIASAAQSDDAQVKVTLAPATACSVSITDATGSFGTWTWDGENDVYVGPTANADKTVSFTGSLYEAKPGGSCPVTLTFTGLVNGPETIGVTNFYGKLDNTSLNGTLPSGVANGLSVPNGMPGGNHSGSLRLNQIPNTITWEPAEYFGTVTVSTGAGQ